MFGIIALILAVTQGHTLNGDYLFIPLLETEYSWHFPGWGSLVTVDIHGRINPVEYSARPWEEKGINRLEVNSDKNFPLYENSRNNGIVYEFRSGRLIMGKMDKAYCFVPKAGKPVITLEEFMGRADFTPRSSFSTRLLDIKNEYGALHPGEPVIYNLPGFFRRKSECPRAIPVTYPKLPPLEKKSISQNEGKHVFVQDDKLMFMMRMGENYYYGHVAMPCGIFAPKHLDNPIKQNEIAPFKLPFLMKPKSPNEPVFEFRNGTLIPGFLMDDKGDFLFVPENGANTIEAETYLKTYSPNSRRIYNLPGKFVEQGKK